MGFFSVQKPEKKKVWVFVKAEKFLEKIYQYREMKSEHPVFSFMSPIYQI